MYILKRIQSYLAYFPIKEQRDLGKKLKFKITFLYRLKPVSFIVQRK